LILGFRLCPCGTTTRQVGGGIVETAEFRLSAGFYHEVIEGREEKYVGWGNFDGEPPLKRGLNDLDGCIGQPVIIGAGFSMLVLSPDVVYRG